VDDEELKLKPFGGARWAANPTRQSLANGRKRISRGSGETLDAKPRQASDRAAGYQPRKHVTVGAVVVP